MNRWSWIGTTMLLVACQSADAPPPEADFERPDALASYRGGAITEQDVDRAVLSLPARERSVYGANALDAYRELIRNLATERILLDTARRAGMEQDPQHQQTVRDLERDALVQQWLRDELEPLEPPTEDDLRARYESDQEAFVTPERRLLLNLFRRLPPEGNADTLRAELTAVREQVLNGASFGVLAAERSESESRHRQGELGWYSPGELPPALEDVVFALEEGVPSQPIATRDGLHLFLVTTILPAQDMSFHDAGQILFRRIVAERNEAVLAAYEATVPLPEDATITDPAALGPLLRGDDPSAVVLQIGDFTIDAAGFRAQLADQDTEPDPARLKPPAVQLLDRLRRRELFYQHLHEGGDPLPAPTAAALALQADRLLAERYLEQQVADRAEQDPEALQTFFESHRERFRPPPRWTLSRLVVPLRADAAAIMDALEALAPSDSAATLEDLATRFDGSIQRLEAVTMAAMRTLSPKLAAFVAPLATGARTPPFRTKQAIEMAEVITRDDPPAPPFEQVTDAVRSAYLAVHGQALVEPLINQLLTDAAFAIDPQHLAALADAPASPPAGDAP